MTFFIASFRYPDANIVCHTIHLRHLKYSARSKPYPQTLQDLIFVSSVPRTRHDKTTGLDTLDLHQPADQPLG